MAVIKAFKGIRPKKGLENKIAALPYDVYNTQEARKVVKENPFSFLKIDRAETQFNDGTSIYDEKVYQKAHDTLCEMLEKGEFVQDKIAYMYIYEVEMDNHVQTGLVACASIDDYLNDVIKKHENTRADKEEDRIRHVDICQAQTGPIFLAYRDNLDVDKIIEQAKQAEPIYNFISEDNIRHTVYLIDDKNKMEKLTRIFEKIENLYIADGHHRAASAVKAGLKRRKDAVSKDKDAEYNYFLSVLFPDNQLKIMDYNRVIKDLNGLTKEEFISRIENVFDIECIGNEQYVPKKTGQISMYISGRWYKLSIKDALKDDDCVKGMDVSLLQDNVLDKILNIHDPKTDSRIEFVGGIRGYDYLEKLVDEGFAVAFAMYPVTMKQLFKVADEKRLMPPKSTWFEPKLRSGIFIHKID